MNSTIFKNIVRFVLLVLVQVLVFSRINIGGDNFNYAQVFIYPIFIMLLPIRTLHTVSILLGFLLGFTIDIFYNSLGVHASACVFMAFIRPYVLSALEPRGGYNVNLSPTKSHFGFPWFAIYSGILLFAHLFFYFSVEAFTFYYFWEIMLRTILSFFISAFFVIMYQYLFDPRE